MVFKVFVDDPHLQDGEWMLLSAVLAENYLTASVNLQDIDRAQYDAYAKVRIDHGPSVGTLALQEANAEIVRLTRLLVESSETIAHLTAVIAGSPPTDGRSKGEQISDALKFDRPLSSYGRSD